MTYLVIIRALLHLPQLSSAMQLIFLSNSCQTFIVAGISYCIIKLTLGERICLGKPYVNSFSFNQKDRTTSDLYSNGQMYYLWVIFRLLSLPTSFRRYLFNIDCCLLSGEGCPKKGVRIVNFRAVVPSHFVDCTCVCQRALSECSFTVA